jgi:hypothetical protein
MEFLDRYIVDFEGKNHLKYIDLVEDIHRFVIFVRSSGGIRSEFLSSMLIGIQSVYSLVIP